MHIKKLSLQFLEYYLHRQYYLKKRGFLCRQRQKAQPKKFPKAQKKAITHGGFGFYRAAGSTGQPLFP